MTKYVNEMEDYLYNHNYISENNNNIKQQELSIERASCIVQKYRTLTEEKDKEIERLNNIIDKTNWWLNEMLRLATNDETKAIINGALELLLKGDNK